MFLFRELSPKNKNFVFAGIALTAGYFIYKYRESKKPRVVGHVDQLFIYPLKSGEGIDIPFAHAAEQGLEWNGLDDRGWAIRYEHNNVKISSREEPRLLRIKIRKISDTEAEFSAPDFRSLKVKIDSIKENVASSIHIFGQDVDCEDIGDEAADWASEYIGKRSRISFKPHGRPCRSYYKKNWRLSSNPIQDLDRANFQDGYPYHILGCDSLDEVNRKIPKRKFTMNNFRPNIVVKAENGRPWDEDGWKGILQIGEAKFAMASPKFRCIVTTIDMETLKPDEDGEPLTTLKTFRQPAGKDSVGFANEKYRTWPMVGMNTVIIEPGKISVGDEIILTPY